MKWSTIKKHAPKFGGIGVINTLFQQGTYLLLVSISVPYMLSQIVSFILSFLLSFFLNCKFNYQVQLTFHRLFEFFKANLPSFLIQAIALRFLVHWIDIPEQVALILTLGVTIPLSFVLITKGMTKDSQTR